MAAVADANYGFRGEVTSAQTPLVFGKGALYSVVGKDDLKVTAGGAGDRAVTVAAGSAWGDGVLSVWDTTAVLNAAANSTGSTRWDTVVIRRHWQPSSTPTGTSTLMILTGGSSKAIAVSRQTDRGVTNSDQPIALVPIANGSATAGTPVGIRCWTGEGGGLVGESAEVLQYLDSKGTHVRIGDVEHARLEDGTGTLYWAKDWVPLAQRSLDLVRAGSGLFSGTTDPGVPFTTLVNGDLPATAPAGLYMVTWLLTLQATGATTGFLRGLVGGVNVTGDTQVAVTTSRGVWSQTSLYSHAGGALSFVLSAKANGGTITAPPGSRIQAAWLGPAA